MHLSSRSKKFISLAVFALTFFFSRHFIFATAFEKLIGNFQYVERKWEEGSLVYSGVTFGDMQAPELKCSPVVSLFPLHLSMGVYVTEPHFALASESAPTFNLALFIPTKWTTIKLDIERGSLSIDDAPLGAVDFLSSDSTDAIGTLILSENEKSAYCTTEVMRQGRGLYYKIHCEEAPVLYLQAFASLFSGEIPLKLEGGKINADLQGSFPSVEGSLHGSGLAFKKGKLAVDQTEAHIKFYLDAPPQMHLKGQLSLGKLEGPYLCYASCQALGASIVDGKFQFAGFDVPFQLYYQNSEAMVHADFTRLPLPGIGLATASVTAIMKQGLVEKLSVKELVITDVQYIESIQGEIECKVPFHMQESTLSWEGNFSVLADDVKAEGVIDFARETWSVEFESPSVVLSKYNDDFPEGTVEVKGVATPQEIRVSCIGKDLLYQKEDKVLQVPGKTSPIEVTWKEGKLAFQTTVPPSTLYLKSVNSPIYLEGGRLFLADEKLAIHHLQACLDEIVFQGELFYAHAPLPRLQLKAESVEGPIQNLSIFDAQVKGWEGYFKCGSDGFFLETDFVSPPQFQVKASIDELSHRFSKEIALSQGTFNLVYESSTGAFQCTDVKGNMQLAGVELPIVAPYLSGRPGNYQFDVQCPSQSITFQGEYENGVATFSELRLGPSHITAPLQYTHQNGTWKVNGAANLDLRSLNEYLALVPNHGISLPPMEGKIGVNGWATETTAVVDVVSETIKIGEITVPSFSGHLDREKNRIQTDNLVIGKAHLQGCAIYENQGWHLPNWALQYDALDLHGSAKLIQKVCVVDLQGTWKNGIGIEGGVEWNMQTRHGRGCRADLSYEGMKLTLRASDLQWKENKLHIPTLQTTLNHARLKDPIITHLTVSGNPERVVFQGPLSQGSYENDLFMLKGKEIQGMYEKGILHFQSKLHLNEKLIQAKGHFFALEGGRGTIHLDQRLKLTMATFSDVSRIEGEFLGIDCSLVKKGMSYDGSIVIKTSDSLAELFKKPEWKQFQNITFQGALSPSASRGTISGESATIKGYLLDHLSASIDYLPTRCEVRQIKIEDPAGKITIKECLATRSHPKKSWEISIPQIRGQMLEPSLIRHIDTTPKNRKPFKVRQLTFENIQGILGRPLTFTGRGAFYFTQKEKRDASLFDLPRAFLKEWGLDLALLSPVRGSATVELKQGKILFTSLHDTFSDGDHSEFYLAETEPSYIDFNGNLSLNLRMKQYVAIKLVEPFTVSVRGTWEKPHYTLR